MGNNIIPTAGVLIIKNGGVLLVRHGEAAGHIIGKYGLPAGRIESNESAKEAARRELKEETRLNVEPDDLTLLPGEWLATIKRKNGTGRFSLTIFLAEKFSGRLKGNTETVPEWIKINDLDNYDLLPSVNAVVKIGLKFLTGEVKPHQIR